MPRFDGYHDEQDLPFRKGHEVIIPKGVSVKSTHPTRKNYVTERQREVEINHILSGQSVTLMMAVKDKYYRRYLEELGVDMDRLDMIAQENPGAAYESYIPVSSPSIRWAGSGGYWCEVDINDILEANGFTLDPIPSEVPENEIALQHRL